jgi:hypothetical protein
MEQPKLGTFLRGKKSMLDRRIVLWTIAACMLATPVAAQSLAPTARAFDGSYIGTATLTHEPRESSGCALTTYPGNVNEAGEVSALLQRQGPVSVISVTGNIHENLFTGQRRLGSFCSHNIQMTKK